MTTGMLHLVQESGRSLLYGALSGSRLSCCVGSKYNKSGRLGKVVFCAHTSSSLSHPSFPTWLLRCCCRLKKKYTQCESYELSFIWGKIRSLAWETASQASQVALRNCSTEVVAKVSTVYDFNERGYMQSSTHFGKGLLLVVSSRCHCE